MSLGGLVYHLDVYIFFVKLNTKTLARFSRWEIVVMSPFMFVYCGSTTMDDHSLNFHFANLKLKSMIKNAKI